ncbi:MULTISPECIES: extracellular solute-binding protein [Pantoea]|uniref:extracellular solute-binding protein n=1 Tax=Pantoea TaxID=53335 RepID=UPI00048DA3A0|nr:MULTISPECIES: extracellular solute-binding protein [Pantoea]MCS3402472.1 extracellular solute-binding protein [Pantoea sp. B566]OWY76566.1 ABC transporter substrate-binding protein [Pantoea sp. AMG 501]
MQLRFALLLLCSLLTLPLHASPVQTSYAFAQVGTPKYAQDFSHYDYVNPAAPKGGKIVLSVIGTYDNFNRYASRGNPGAGTGPLYDSLFTTSDDETSSYYPLIAESARHPVDFSWMDVTLNPRARFQDGSPITAEDVAFTFQKFMTEGVPQFRIFYRGVTVTALNRQTVRIRLPAPDKDLMLGLLTLPVISQTFWQTRKFNEPLSQPPLSSGPYRISKWKLGQFIEFSRVNDYWAADLPVNRGRFNFDVMRYDYYLDDNVAFEAFKAGAFDLREETSAKKWATQYLGRHFDDRQIVKETTPNTASIDTRWLALNNEKALFSDRRVRQAMALAFDFEWMNKTLFYQAFKRTDSYFQNTHYAARGLPDAAQLRILTPFAAQLPPEVFSETYVPPQTDGSGYDRTNLLKAMSLLNKAGWHIRNQRLINDKTGQPFSAELLLPAGANSEWALPYQHNLARLGITLTLRQIDSSQYLRRLRSGDYDMVSNIYHAMPTPSRSLQANWQSDYIQSSWNTARVKDPVVDSVVKQIIAHQDDADALLPLGRALDRILLWNAYMIPMWYNAEQRLAFWDKFSHPAVKPAYSTGLDNWWYDVNKAGRLPADKR